MTGDVLYIIPLVTRLLAKMKQYLHTVCLSKWPFVVLIRREIVRKRRWRCLATGHAGVKWPYYLQINNKEVNQAKNPISLTAVNFCVHKSTDWQIANYCSCCCHLSKLKSSRTHPKPIGISVYMSIIADYTTSSITHGIVFWSENCIPIDAYIWSFFFSRLSCSSTSNRIRSVHVNLYIELAVIWYKDII
jgi:hypothetical protein